MTSSRTPITLPISLTTYPLRFTTPSCSTTLAFQAYNFSFPFPSLLIHHHFPSNPKQNHHPKPNNQNHSPLTTQQPTNNHSPTIHHNPSTHPIQHSTKMQSNKTTTPSTSTSKTPSRRVQVMVCCKCKEKTEIPSGMTATCDTCAHPECNNCDFKTVST